MIPNCKIMRVKRLLAEGGHTYRRIAKDIDISRATVGAIADGTRREQPERELKRQVEEASPYRSGEVRRCSGCGNKMSRFPCMICKHRRKKDAERLERRRERGRMAIA